MLGMILIVLGVVGYIAGVRRPTAVGVGAIGVVCVLFCRAGHDDSGYNF